MSAKNFFLMLAAMALTTGAVSAGGTQNRTSGQPAAGPMVITTMGAQMAPIADHPKIIEYYNKLFNVDIRVWNADNTKINQQRALRFAANEIPDFFRAELNNLRTYYDQQVLEEIPEALVREKMPLIVKDYTETLPNWLQYVKVNGKIYMLPGGATKDSSARKPLVYRGDWLKNLGVAGTPKTLAEFEPLMYRFANDDPDKNGKKDTYGLSSTAMEVVYGAYGYIPGQWNERNGQMVYSSIQPEVKEALGVLAKWYKDGVIDPEFITGENKGGYWPISHAFIEGRVGVSSNGGYYHWYFPGEANNANYNEMVKTNPAAAELMTYGEPVTGPTGKKGLSAGFFWDTADMFALGAQLDKDPSKMAKIFEIQNCFWESDVNFITASLGIQGEYWNYDQRGIPLGIEGVNSLAEGAGTVMRRFFGSQFLRIMEPNRAVLLEQHKFYQDGLRNEVIVPLPSQGTYMTELTKIQSETFLSIITGEKPLSAFDQFVTQWKAGGGDTLTKEANDWRNSMR